ncbi:PREDICTED: putative F-box [Prunus dulcis]|uniref:PREDICTED: putative F-box n=1 Tax=Prunus dulcis TaxID=3755 RepID=A0A5E4EW99_PRUDU|nr:hypothetical protein L3X38_004863 [Prunus dulcis]VVA20035.1 PREDICTED: putative F-box [Prunus dulcis]
MASDPYRWKIQRDDTLRFFSLAGNKVYKLKNAAFRGSPFEGFHYGTSCVGSWHGCLVIWNKEDDDMMHLLNPIYGSRIQLPYYKTQVVKDVVSCEPCRSDNFVVVMDEVVLADSFMRDLLRMPDKTCLVESLGELLLVEQVMVRFDDDEGDDDDDDDIYEGR